MFPTPAFDAVRVLRMTGGDGHARFTVRGLPETIGEMPSAGLADEIETPGDGQVRALLTFAGNLVHRSRTDAVSTVAPRASTSWSRSTST